jgi:1-acyl-sn-glycerol-3-phosphate acyltransferase
MIERLTSTTAILDSNLKNESWRIKLENFLIECTQFLSWPLFYLIFNILFRVEIEGEENLQKIGNAFIITANHISFFDSFILRIIGGIFNPLLPLRFMAVKKFNFRFLNILYSVGIIPLVYLLFGVFTVVPGAGLKRNLEKPIQILKNGGNVLIYPEGQINKENSISEFKSGAVVLAQLTHAPVLPIVFRINSGNLILRKTLKIRIGVPMFFSGEVSTLDSIQVLRRNMIKMYDSAK